MSLPALDDITTPIDGVIRIETAPREKATPIIMEMMRSVYPHDQVFGEYCTVNDYVDCPPDELFEYLSDTRSLEEWTYSLRGFTPTKEPGLWLAYDRLGSEMCIRDRFEYLSDTRSLEEWTYSLRGFTPTDEPGLWQAYDRLGSELSLIHI